MSDFAIGQRWLSETEIELGLGIVTGISGRQVSLLFPANGEERAYAAQQAPLTRHSLDLDEEAQHADGWSFTVRKVDEQSGVLVYHGEKDGQPVQVPETQLHFQVQLSSPLNRLLAGQFDRVSHFNLRQQASASMRDWLEHPARGLLGARIELLPHQIYIGHTVGGRAFPRVLLADEVGLGKTIEAGLIMQSQLLNAQAQRVLVRVPDPLLHQWMIELRRRFNLMFTIVDQSFCEAAAESEENPFNQVQLALCPASLLEQDKHVAAAQEAGWDLVVVDEAHQLTAPQRSVVQQLSHEAGLLLLTATPDQGGADSHFEQLHLLDPDRFHSLEAFVAEQEKYQQVADQAADLDENSEALNELLDEHGTGRVLMRNTRANITGFPQRRYQFYPLTSGDDDGLQRKVEWLHNLARSHSNDKILVIMQTQADVEEVAALLRIHYGRHSALFHEGMSLLERDRSAAFFADDEDGAQLLLSSEIGGEGRNFQFARHLVMLDLPTHPDKLEQRIGRLDRIGQLQAFDIHLAASPESREARLARWYDEGMQAFTQPNATGHRLMQQLGDDLETALAADTATFDAFISRTANEVAAIRSHLAAGRDRLLELNSCRMQPAQALCQAIEESEHRTELASFMFAFWDQFGVQVEDKDDQRLIIKPGQNFAANGLPGLDEEGSVVTFDRVTALRYDDAQFLTWEHPQVLTALDLVICDNHGSACVGILKNKALPAGHWFIEMHVRASLPQAPALGLEKLYPCAPVRLLLDSQGRNLNQKITADTLNKQLHFVNKKSAAQMIKALRKPLQAVVKQTLPEAESVLQQQCADAAARRLQGLENEIERLQHLQTRNPSIRDEEIEALQLQQASWKKAFAAPQISIDSIRVIVNAGTEGG
ncbi:RNA polymerase-associated protein RapA [Aliidiomarina sedimenti]|uniref:RNA polymerase-associated protein RapA n=1 Tax=Aliidiomarina sedimenti TaxID=1933879 RepID=A0ABY0BUI9_9GAMM|nr:helicase-related protein [Aliidiomarina sedimenti]RUO27904.1 RNA polymerase-associated protein RapA [Aliidiomarina sedimenti]